MTIQLTPQSVILGASLVGALGALLGYIAKGVRWFDRQKAQDSDITNLERKHDQDMHDIKEDLRQAVQSIKTEQQLLVYGLLACLRGLQEQGCNGPVTEAINKIEKYLNKKAHYEGGESYEREIVETFKR